jgi:hypothetical protein
MGWFGGRRVKAQGADRFRLDLPAPERAVLRSMAGQLRILLEADTDPALRRLYPTAYHEEADVEKDAEYHLLMHGDLRARRLDALAAFERTLDATQLDAAELHGWMTAVNDIRLVLGTKLDVTEDLDLGDLDDDDPEAPAFAIYAYLGGLLEELVEAAMR